MLGDRSPETRIAESWCVVLSDQRTLPLRKKSVSVQLWLSYKLHRWFSIYSCRLDCLFPQKENLDCSLDLAMQVIVKFLQRGSRELGGQISKMTEKDICSQAYLQHPHFVDFKGVLLTAKHLGVIMEHIEVCMQSFGLYWQLLVRALQLRPTRLHYGKSARGTTVARMSQEHIPFRPKINAPYS